MYAKKEPKKRPQEDSFAHTKIAVLMGCSYLTALHYCCIMGVTNERTAGVFWRLCTNRQLPSLEKLHKFCC